MSRAFVKEPDGDQVGDDQPEWPISSQTNFVTATGWQQLQDKRTVILAKQEQLNADKTLMANKTALAQVGRELRYYTARIASAQIVQVPADKSLVKIGASVTVIDEQDINHQFTIVGEDEAEIKLGKISWISPLATALLDRELDDVVTWRRPIGDVEVEISKIEYL